MHPVIDAPEARQERDIPSDSWNMSGSGRGWEFIRFYTRAEQVFSIRLMAPHGGRGRSPGGLLGTFVPLQKYLARRRNNPFLSYTNPNL